VSRSKNPPAPAGYHHGALRDALLGAAEAILLEGGIEAFTLRECARRAGVSHAAPAHHFGDARGLLTAFATVGFDRMADLMQRYRRAAGGEPLAQLTGVGRGYIDFAVRHPAHFLLMFGRTGDMLRDTMAATLAAAGRSPAELPARMLLAWSAVHGYATLVVEGQCADLFGLDVSSPRKSSAMGELLLHLLAPALGGNTPAKL
jgi:AcrR family transcriptional regulator